MNWTIEWTEKGSYQLKVFLNYIATLLKWYESEIPVGKDSLYDSVSLNQSDNENIESDSTTFSSSNLNFESSYFGNKLKSFCINNINQITIGQINKNLIRSKFDDPVKMGMGNIDILMIFETKPDANFPISQFSITGYSSPYRLDWHVKYGGVCPRVNLFNAEGFFWETNLRKKKWAIYCLYNLHNQTISSNLENIGKDVDSIYSEYANFLMIGL